jgi:hypothetical protein
MSGPNFEARAAVAAHHGLDHAAAKFLVGETIEELETSAASLARLLQQRLPQEPAADALDPFAGTSIAKQVRQQQLLAALTGRSPRRRDERGRFATNRGSFDGGARQSTPAPPELHNETLVKLLRTGAANAGRRL